MGLYVQEDANAAKEEVERMSNMREEETRGVAVLGGRMGSYERNTGGFTPRTEKVETKQTKRGHTHTHDTHTHPRHTHTTTIHSTNSKPTIRSNT